MGKKLFFEKTNETKGGVSPVIFVEKIMYYETKGA
jgi:hypothetical protein